MAVAVSWTELAMVTKQGRGGEGGKGPRMVFEVFVFGQVSEANCQLWVKINKDEAVLLAGIANANYTQVSVFQFPSLSQSPPPPPPPQDTSTPMAFRCTTIDTSWSCLIANPLNCSLSSRERRQ
jgi:hypothetical protein